MNGKKAKAMRRLAEEQSPDMKGIQLAWKDRNFQMIVNHPSTTRAVYRNIKKYNKFNDGVRALSK